MTRLFHSPSRFINIPSILLVLFFVGFGVYYYHNGGASKFHKYWDRLVHRQKYLKEGDYSLVVRYNDPSTYFILPDTESLLMLTGKAPHVYFNSVSNSTSNESSATVDGLLNFYSDGYYFKLKNTGCSGSIGMYVDARTSDPEECSLDVSIHKGDAPVVKIPSVEQSVNLGSSFEKNISEGEGVAFIRLYVPSVRSAANQDSSGSPEMFKESESKDDPLQDGVYLFFLTSYGKHFIYFNRADIWAENERKLTLGALDIKAHTEKYNCQQADDDETECAFRILLNVEANDCEGCVPGILDYQSDNNTDEYYYYMIQDGSKRN